MPIRRATVPAAYLPLRKRRAPKSCSLRLWRHFHASPSRSRADSAAGSLTGRQIRVRAAQGRLRVRSRIPESVRMKGRTNSRSVKSCDVPLLITGESESRGAPFPQATLFVRAFDAQHQRPLWPGSMGSPLLGGHGHDFELVNGKRPLPVRGAQTVSPRIAAADDDNALACGEDFVL